MRKIIAFGAAFALLALSGSSACAQSVNGGAGQTVNGAPVNSGGSGGTPANPSATAGDTAVNGSASTYMRSDAAPAVQKGSSSQFGIVKVDGSTITATGGVISATSGSGTITGVTAGAGLTGGGTSGSVTLSLTEELGNSGAAITGTTYSVDLADDMAKQLLFTGSSASAWDDTGTATSGGFDIVNAGTANVTWTPTDGIDGGSSIVVPFGSWAHVFFDGTTWRSEPGKNLSGVTAGTYGDSTHCVSITVDKYGRLTAASQSTSCPGGSASIVSPSNYTAGNFFFTSPSAKGPSATGMTSGTVYFTDLTVFKPITINQLGTFVATTDASGHFAVALYAVDATTGYATGAPLVTSASLGTTSNSSPTMDTGLSSTALPAGHYKFAFQTDSATAQFMSAAGSAGYEGYAQGSDTAAHMVANVTTYDTVYSIAGTYGSWPTMNGTLCGTGNCTTITSGFNARNVVGIMKVASVP